MKTQHSLEVSSEIVGKQRHRHIGERVKTASEEVTDMIFLSKWSSQTLCAGAELGVFDYLSCNNTRSAGDVAAETGLDPALLYRLLRALASLVPFEQDTWSPVQLD